MAREFAFVDSFDCYDQIGWRWDDAWGGYGDANWYHSVAAIVTTGGRLNSGRMHVSTYTGGARRSRFSSEAVWTVGVACKPSLQGGGMHAVTLLNGMCPNVGVRITATGGLQVFTFDNGGWVYSYYIVYDYTVIGEYFGPAFHANSWNYLEFKVLLHASAGTIEVRVNGVTSPLISETGVRTIYTGTLFGEQPGTANGLVLGGYKEFDPACGACSMDFDDLFVDVGADSEFRGDCHLYLFLPKNDGTYSEWSPSAGNNYECVDEAVPNNDTDYVQEGTPGIRDTYLHDPLPTMPDGATVHCVAVSACAKKAQPGIAEIAPMIRSNTTDSPGDTFVPVAESYNYYTSFWEQDPATAAAWTVNGVNDMEFGQKVIT